MTSIEERQQALNRTSADRWELFASHRERLTGALLQLLPPGGGRVCILGAGNCNDVDLRALTAAGAEVHLVDIDGEAMERGVARQGGMRTVLHGGVEISGIATDLETPSGSAAAFDALLARVRAPHVPIPSDFHVALSPCLLTQLAGSVAEAAGEDHPRLAELTLAVREGHLRMLIERLAPGGRALLATEVTSTDVAPALASIADDDLGPFLFRAIATGALFTHTSPAALSHWLAAHRPRFARLAPPGFLGPWRWRLNRRLEYLVLGMLLRPVGA